MSEPSTWLEKSRSQVARYLREADWQVTSIGPPGSWPQTLRTAVSICLNSPTPSLVWWGRGQLTQICNDACASLLDELRVNHRPGMAADDCWQSRLSHITPAVEQVFSSGEVVSVKPLDFSVGEGVQARCLTLNLHLSPLHGETGEVQGVFVALVRAESGSNGDAMAAVLRKSEARLSLALDGGHMGLWDWDLINHTSVWNDKEYEILGLTPGEGSESTDRFLKLIHPDDAPRLQQRLNKLFEAGNDWHDEFRITRPDGEVRWLAGVGRLYRDHEGRPSSMIGVNYDITERKRDELVARQSRDRFKFLTEASQVGVWFCDLPFEELNWDERVKEHFWLPPDARVTISTFFDGIHPDDREPTRLAIQKAIDENTRYDIDYRTESPEGRIKWIRAIGHASYDASGKPLRFDGVTIDVTDKKHADEAVVRKTQQMESLLHAAPMGIYLVDADFRIAHLNPIARGAFGDISGLEGMDLGEAIHRLWNQERADRIVEVFRHTLETGESHFVPELSEFRMDRGVQEYYEWQVHRTPLMDGRHGVVCYFRDISARVLADQRLRQAQAETERQRRLYDTILSVSPDLSYVFDLNHRFVYANDLLLRMWGKTWDEAIGKNCLELGYEPWHAAMHDREIEQVVATKKPIRGDVPFAGTFGRRIYDYIFVPIFNAEGEVEAVAGTTRDVTERKNSEVRHSFLVDLDDALRPLSDPHELVTTAARVLGGHLAVDRCAYADVEADGDTMNLTGNYLRSPEIKDIVGRLRFSDFGAEVHQLMREGKPYVVQDIDTHVPAVLDRAAYQAAQIQSVICVPLHKSGRFVAAMAVHMATPRVWTQDEVGLLSLVAARCWESIERVRLERGLQETENRFRTMADAAPVLIWISDVNKACTWFNKAWMAFTGRAMEGLLGSGWTHDIHPEDLDRCVTTYIQSFDSRQPFSVDYRLRRSDGVYCWMLGRGIPRFESNGEFAGYIGSCLDITERRLAEEKLRQSEERFRAFVTTSSDVVYRMSPDWSEMRQLDGRDFIANTSEPTHDWVQKYIHPDDQPRVLEAVREAIQTKSAFQLEHRVYQVDGSLGWTFSRAIPLLDSRGEIAEWFGAASDVTERRRAEEVLRASEERARAASLAKDNFLAQLSHELRTPLTPVLMTAAALREDASVGATAREAFAMIERNVSLEARLIDDLLDLTRVTRGKLVLREEPCDVHFLLRQALDIVRDEVREKQIPVTVNLKAEHHRLRGDSARLQQVFWNLLQNAVKYTPQGGHISVSTSAAGDDHMGIEICDDGMGFEPAESEKLFQPFHQAEHSKSAGLGLGLAIARSIVELHHGQIVGSSAGIGQGARFVVTLPVERSLQLSVKEHAQERGQTQDGTQLRTLRLLMVEDHEPTLQVLSRHLIRAGHSVEVARSLAEARSLARAHAFDAVVSDLGLPDGTGIDLMATLRDEHGLRGVALSGYGMEEDIRRSRDAGFVAHLVKPVRFEDLQRVLRTHFADATPSQNG